MKSKTSFFNVALLKKNTLRFSPIWIAYLAMWVLVLPLMLMMSLSSPWKPDLMDISQNICAMLTVAGPAVCCVYGLVLAMAVFSYLHSARSVAMMHSLPIRRSGLYLTNYISGLLFIVVPNAVVAVLTALVTLAGGVFCPGMVLAWFLGMCALGLFFYSFAVFVTMFTGNLVAVPIFYAILNGLCFVLYWTFTYFVEPFLYGMYSSINAFEDVVTLLTPLMCMYRYMDVARSYQVGADGFDEVARVDLSGGWVPVLYAVAGVVLAVLAYIVYRRRRSETAGDVVTVGWARALFRYGVGLTAALTIGQGIYYLLFESSALGGVAMELVVMILAAAVGYLVAQMLLHKSFRVVKKSVRGSAVCAVVILAVSAGAALDVTGFTRRIPDVDRVQGVNVTFSGYHYSDVTLCDRESIEKVVDIHRFAVEHRREMKDGRGSRLGPGISYSYMVDEEDVTYTTFRVDYQFKDGSMMSRRYILPLRIEDAGDPDTITGCVSALTDSADYRATDALGALYTRRGENLQVTGMTFYYYGENDVEVQQSYRLNEAERKALYAALMEDAEAGRMPRVLDLMDYEQVDQIRSENEYVNEVEVEFRVMEEDGVYIDYQSNVYFYLTKDMTSTIAALEDLGIVNDSVRLRTRAQQDAMYSGQYREEELPSTSVEVPEAAAGVPVEDADSADLPASSTL